MLIVLPNLFKFSQSLKSTSTLMPLQPANDVADKIAYIHSKDPNWNEQKFKELVNIWFFKIQNAWCAWDMSSARAFISDGIMRRFTLQLEPYKAKNQHNVLERLSLDRVDILDIHTDEKYIYMKTLINASCVDTVVDADDGSVSEVHNHGELEHWKEIWIWMRSNSVLTKDTESWIFVDKCPNCWSTLKINSIGKCDYCGTEVTKWEFDWVLSEIDQIDA
jgi:predicted lipid-binding transport protein (Tim44 family)